MTPAHCPRYERCNAPICPLDPRCLQSQHLPGECVCLWLRELSKPHGEDTLRSVLRGEVAATVARVAPGIIATHGCVRSALQRASQQGSKLASGRALRNSDKEA